MVEVQNDCVGCEYCVHCGLKHAVYMFCDKCKNSVDELYEYEGEQLCQDCLLNEVPKVKPEEEEEEC